MVTAIVIEWPMASVAGTDGMGSIVQNSALPLLAVGSDLPKEDTFVYWSSQWNENTQVVFFHNHLSMVRDSHDSSKGTNMDTSFAINQAMFGQPITLTAALYRQGDVVGKDPPLVIDQHTITFVGLTDLFPFVQSSLFAVSQLVSEPSPGNPDNNDMIRLELYVLDFGRTPIQGAEVLWIYEPPLARGDINFWVWDANSQDFKPAPLDPFTQFAYSLSGEDGGAVIYITARRAIAVHMRPKIIGSHVPIFGKIYFGNVNGNEPQQIKQYMFPDQSTDGMYYRQLALKVNYNYFTVSIPNINLNSSDDYFITLNNILVANGLIQSLTPATKITIGYAGLAPQTNEPQPPPQDLNDIVFYRQDLNGFVIRTLPSKFFSYGTWIGNMPPTTDQRGNELYRHLPVAHVLKTVGGRIMIDTIDRYHELRVMIPPLPSEFDYTTATVRLYMNGYWSGTTTPRAGSPDDPGLTVKVTIVPGGTTVPFEYDAVYGYSVSPAKTYLTSYVDYNIGDDDYMELGVGYETDTSY